MPKGKKHRFSLKQDKLAESIAKEYRKKGYSKKRARSIGFATVVKNNLKKGKRKRKLKSYKML